MEISKILFVVIILLILRFVLRAFRRNWSSDQQAPLHPDSSEHFEDLVRRLMHSTSDDSFLVVGVENSEDFLQMTASPFGIQLDFPLITDRQKSLESRIRESAGRQGLTIQETQGTDGNSFLDIDINGEPGHVAAVCRRFMAEIYGATGARFRYEHDGLAER